MAAGLSIKGIVSAVKQALGQPGPTWGYYTVPLGSISDWRAWGTNRNWANQNVTVDTSLNLSAVWACIRLLAETISTLPLIIYRDLPFDARIAAKDYFLYPILHDRPNPDHTAVEFWEGVLMGLCTWGNAFARKRMINGQLVSLEQWVTEDVTVYRTPQTGQLRYRYRSVDGTIEDLPESQVFHVRGFGPCDDLGLSPITYARQTLGLAMAQEQSSSRVMANGARPSGVLTVDQLLKDDQRKQINENVVKPFTTTVNQGGVMVLEAGMKYQQVSMSLADAQMLQSRQFSVEEICRWFRVPPFMIGHTEKVTAWGTGLEQMNAGFLIYALRPYLSRIEQAISRSLIPVEDRGSFHPEFKVDALLRADSQVRVNNYATLVQNGIMTRNEVRRLENLPPLPGGEDLTAQAQNMPLRAIQNQTATPRPAPGEPARAANAPSSETRQ